MLGVTDWAHAGRQAGVVILNERLQREGFPSRNSFRVPGKNSCFYFLQEIFTRNKMLLCFVLFSLEVGFRCNARIWISPSHFGQPPLGKLQMLGTGFWSGPHHSHMNSECVWREVWFGASPCTQGSMEADKYSQKKTPNPQSHQLSLATDVSLSWTLRHWKEGVCKPAPVWHRQKMEMAKEISNAIWNWKPVL